MGRSAGVQGLQPFRLGVRCGKEGQEDAQRMGLIQDLQHARRALAHQSPGEFLPDALGHQGMDFASSRHLAHQRQGFGGDGEIGKAGGEAGQTQDAHGVLAKGGADVAEDPGLDVGLSMEGIDEAAVGGTGDGVDGEVTAQQVVFQRDIRREMHGKALVAGCGLALGAGQCVFLVALGVQEDGEVLADGLKALGQHLFRRGAHHHPVAVAGGQPQQFVTDGPADAVDLELGDTGIGGGHDVSCCEGGAGFSGCLDHASMAVADIMATVPPPAAVA